MKIDETRPYLIERFAKRYGYLGVLSEAPRRSGGIFVKAADEYKGEYSVFRGVLAEAQSGLESLKNWYFWSREFRFVLSEFESIWRNEEPVHWEYEEFHKLYARVKPSKEKVNQWRLSRLSDKLTCWLHLGGAGRLVVNCRSLQLETHCAFSALTRAFASTLCDEGALLCSGCGRFFPRERHASQGSRIYCERCRVLGIPVRDAVRDYRKRKASLIQE